MSLPIPLAVRLQTRRADRHVTRDLASLRFRDVAPGGFAACSLELQRPLDIGAPELAHYGRVYIYDGRSGETVWEGYQDNPVGSAGPDGEVVTVTAAGPSARTLDRTATLIYADMALERWDRSGDEAGSSTDVHDGNTGFYVRQHKVPRAVDAVPPSFLMDSVYRTVYESDLKLGGIYFGWDGGKTDTNWKVKIFIGGTSIYTAGMTTTGDTSVVLVYSTDIPTNGAPGGGLDAWVVTARLQRETSTVTVADDVTWARWGVVTPLVIRGLLYNAGGTERTTGYSLRTLPSSDVVKDLLGRLLPTYDGANARVDTTTYQIDQLAYPGGATPAAVLEDLMTLDPAYYWAAWEGVDPFGGKSRFEWRTWPSAVRYELTVLDGYQPRSAGADLYDRVRVRHLDQIGRTRTVVRTQTVQALADAGIIREGFLDLGGQAGSAGNAAQAGDGFLGDHAFIPNAGTLSVARPVLDLQTGRMVPPYLIRPGYLCRVRGVAPTPDTLNGTVRDGSTIFRIAAKDYDTDSAAASLELDTYPRTVAQAIARARAALARTRRL